MKRPSKGVLKEPEIAEREAIESHSVVQKVCFRKGDGVGERKSLTPDLLRELYLCSIDRNQLRVEYFCLSCCSSELLRTDSLLVTEGNCCSLLQYTIPV